MNRTLPLCLAAGLLVLAPPFWAAGSDTTAPWVAPARTFEDQAEDAVDALAAQPVDAAWVKRLMAEMASSAEALRAAAAGDAAVARQADLARRDLREARTLMAAGNYPAAALAVNQVTGALQPIEGMSTPQERDVARLDYLSREVVALSRLPAAGPGTGELRERMEEIRTVWARLRPWYATRPGAARLVAWTDACVSRIVPTASAKERTAAGGRLGDLVDQMETYLPR